MLSHQYTLNRDRHLSSTLPKEENILKPDDRYMLYNLNDIE